MTACPFFVPARENIISLIPPIKEETLDLFHLLRECIDDTMDLSEIPPDEKPDWVDDELLARGQEFARKHYASVCFGQMLSLYLLFSFQNNLHSLIFTQKSGTVEKAARRYYSTIMKVMSWYESDPWDSESDAYKNIVDTRFQHKSVCVRLNSAGKDEVLKRINAIKQGWSEDTRVYLDATNPPKPYDFIEDMNRLNKYVTQPEMTFTQFGFMGLVLLFPEKLGIYEATDDELFAFVHLWRNLGHRLGIHDQINLCTGSLNQVRGKCTDILQVVFMPNLYATSVEWEHMTRCMANGIGLLLQFAGFEDSLLYLFWMLEVKCDRFKSQLPLMKLLKFYGSWFVLRVILRFPFLKKIVNARLKEKLVSLAIPV